MPGAPGGVDGGRPWGRLRGLEGALRGGPPEGVWDQRFRPQGHITVKYLERHLEDRVMVLPGDVAEVRVVFPRRDSVMVQRVPR